MNSTSEASAHCRSSNSSTTGPSAASRSKRTRQAPKSSSLPQAPPSSRPSRWASLRLDELPLLGVRHVLVEGRVKLRQRGITCLALDDACAHPHHLGERPVGDPLAVGEAAAAVPVHELDQPVEVLLELPAEAGLADACDADDRHQLRAALLGGDVEELLDEPQLAVAADERRLEPHRLLRASPGGGHAQRLPERHGLGLALQLVVARFLVGDRRLRQALGRLADEHRPRRGRRLDAGGGVDQVARDHPLAVRADRDGRLARQDARTSLQAAVELRAQPRRGRAPCVPPARRRPPAPPASPTPPSPRRR